MHDAAIVVDNLRVVRGKTAALGGVTFTIVPGKITGLLGPSGSGKTTLMRAIIGAQQITSGTLEVLGLPAGHETLRSKIGYVTQMPAVYNDLTTKQNLEYFAAILGVSAQGVSEVLRTVDLEPQAEQLAGSLSGGQIARVSLAVALLAEMPVLILDEPTVGLDPVLRQKLWDLFRSLAKQGRTLLVSSHVMDEAEHCDDILLLRDGKVLSHGTKKALLHDTKTTSVEQAFLKLAGGNHES